MMDHLLKKTNSSLLYPQISNFRNTLLYLSIAIYSYKDHVPHDVLHFVVAEYERFHQLCKIKRTKILTDLILLAVT